MKMSIGYRSFTGKLLQFSSRLGLLTVPVLGSLWLPLNAEPFADGTRYAAIGDSVTHGGRYPFYIELYYLTRFPTQNVQVFNCGISGDTAGGAIKRFPADILPVGANAASLMFGMNDVCRYDYGVDKTGEAADKARRQHIDDYEQNIRSLIDLLQKNNVTQITLFTPSIYDDTSTMAANNEVGVDGGLVECAKRLTKIAADYKLPVVDFHTPMRQLSLKFQEKDPAGTIVGPDRIHPGPSGHLFMTYYILKAQQAPAAVAAFSIEASEGKIESMENCRIERIHAGKSDVKFSYMANAIPFPLEEAARPALEWIPFTDEYNREIVQVTGLASGTYALMIDGNKIRTYTADELGQGVNIGMEANTPQYKQAQHVLQLGVQRWDLISKIRDLTMVELSIPEELVPPITLEKMKPLIEARLKKTVGTPWEGYTKNTGEAYLENKLHEPELVAQAEKLRNQMRTASIPSSHEVELKLIQPSTDTSATK